MIDVRVLAVCLSLHAAFASAETPAATATATPEPPRARGTASASVGGKKVTIDYGRPVLKGRTVADLLAKMPEDRVWRAGENQVTTLSTEGDVTIGGQKVPAGKYSLYVHAPASGDWALLVNKDLGVPLGTIYDKAPENLKNEPWPQMQYGKVAGQEVARARLTRAKVEKGPSSDSFTIDLAPAGKGARLTLSWGDESWSADVQAAK